MNLYFGSIFLAVFSNIFYHLCVKATDSQVNPMLSLTLTYTTAALVSLILSPFFKNGIRWSELAELGWPTYGLGISICFLELGFLLAYRAGWKISAAALYCNIAVGVLLLPIGLLFFRETMSLQNAVGTVLAIAGLVLIGMR